MAAPTSPYKGLVPFTEDDAPFFFGRNAEKQTIAFNLRGMRLTLLYGPTGVGKSSVLKAGVSHDLRKLAEEQVRKSGKPELIVIVINSWRDDPVSVVIQHVKSAVQPYYPQFPLNGFAPAKLGQVLARWTDQLHCELLIILDQFEEYFLYHESLGDHAPFVRELSDAVNDSNLASNFLISIREDQLSKLDLFKGRIPSLFDNYLRVEHLSLDAGREAIVKPLEVYNTIVRPEQPFEIEPELVEAVSEQVLSVRLNQRRPIDPGDMPVKSNQIEAPLLQLVMNTIWLDETRSLSSKLRLGTLTRLGGAQAIAIDHLDNELEDLSDAERAIVAQVFHYLVTPSGSKIAHTLGDLCSYANLKTTDVEPVLRKLTDEGRILRTVPSAWQTGGSRYEIFHDVLAKGVLDWLANYAKNKQIEEERQHFKQQKEEFRREEQRKLAKARRRSTLLAIIVFSLAGLIVLITILWVYALSQKKKSVLAEIQVQAERDRLQQEIDYNIKLEAAAVPYSKGILKGHAESVRKAIFSPDGRTAASASDDGTAIIWDLQTNKAIRQWKERAPVVDLAFDPSGQILALATSNTIVLLDVATAASTNLVNADAKVTKVSFSPIESARLLAGASEDGTIKLWDFNGRLIREFRGHTGPITDITFSRDGGLLASASVDHTARLWHVHSDRDSIELKGHTQAVNSIRFSANDRFVVTSSDDSTAQIWNASNGQRIGPLKEHGGPVRFADFGPKDDSIVTAGADKLARVWDFTTKRKVAEMRGHADEIMGAGFSSDRSRVITSGADHTARIWEVPSGRMLYELRAHFGAVMYSEFSPDGTTAITASADKTVRLWKVNEVRTLQVTDVRVSIEPTNYEGPCPAYVRIFGRITVEGGSGTVKYRFVRKNMQSGIDREITFDGPGTKDVGSVYKFGGEHFPTVSGTFYLQITSPGSLKSQDVSFNVKCEAVAEGLASPSP